MPEDFRYVWSDGSPGAEFRAVSLRDAVAFARAHYELDGPDARIARRLQCRVGDDWHWACDQFGLELVGASAIP